MQGIKCMLVGDSRIGKSHLFHYFTTGTPPPQDADYIPTVYGGKMDILFTNKFGRWKEWDLKNSYKFCFISYNRFDTITKQIEIKGVEYSLALWDSAGDSTYDEIRPISYPHTDCFLICYSVDDRTSFERVESKWKPEILRYGDGPSVPLILAGLKSDLTPQKQCSNNFISYEEGQELQKKIGASHFFQVSTIPGEKDTENVTLILDAMIESAMARQDAEDAPKNPNWGFEHLKILIVGDSTTGKSSILRAYMNPENPIKEVHQPTTDVEFHYRSLVLDDGIEYFLTLTDLPSAPEFLHDRIKEYQKADGVIFCYAVNDPFSFQNLENEWIPEVRKYCPNIKSIIIGNKSDLKPESTILIPSVDGKELQISCKSLDFIECSAKSLENVEQVLLSCMKAFKKSIPNTLSDTNNKNEV